jgi:hypothetical protein
MQPDMRTGNAAAVAAAAGTKLEHQVNSITNSAKPSASCSLTSDPCA